MLKAEQKHTVAFVSWPVALWTPKRQHQIDRANKGGIKQMDRWKEGGMKVDREIKERMNKSRQRDGKKEE